jgi:Do/DeqQ family serine protease
MSFESRPVLHRADAGDMSPRRLTAALLVVAGCCVGAATALIATSGLLHRSAAASPLPARGASGDAHDARGGGAGVPGSPGGAGAAAGGSAGPLGEGFAPIAREVMPAVVNISSLQITQTYERYSPFFADPFFQQFFGGGGYDYVVPRERREMSLGSGVIVDDKGTILTNNHVVENAAEVSVSLSDGRTLKAEILGVDERTDLAALRVKGSNLPYARLGNSDALQVGDIVLAFGNPFGFGGTVTMGIVSAMGRGNLGLADYEDFIQTDAAINPGNSGGALVNTRAEVVGINTAIFSRSGGYQGIGFAIPSTMAHEVLDDLIEHGKVVRGYAGLKVQPLTSDLASALGTGETRGAVVSSLDPQGPSAAAGLKRGDVIVSVRDHPVTSDEDLRTQLSRLRPGDRTTLGVMRGGQRVSVDLTLAEPPQAPRAAPPRRRR